MKVKLLEVRDRGTFLPVVAIKCEPANDAEQYLLEREGYTENPEDQSKYVLISPLRGNEPMVYDPVWWGDRTFQVAHKYILEHFGELATGDVVDVEHILGERQIPKEPERYCNRF
jgi:hypothetical protein